MKKHKVEQRSDEWHHLRKGKITGTVLKGIMGTPRARQEALYEYIGERLTVGVGEDENAMDRGVRLEPEAVSAFEFATGIETQPMGLCENEDDERIAYSPDRLIGETKDIEVKCPGGKNYVKMWLTNKVPDEYEWQLVQAFVVNPKLEKRYFVGYNPDIPVHPIHIIEVNRKDILPKIEEAKLEQEKFLGEAEAELSKVIKF